MRITSQMMHHGILRSMQDVLGTVNRAQREATTGRRIHTVSDDPVTAAQIMRFSGQIRDIDQFRRTGITASTRLSAEDSVLSTVSDLVRQAKEMGALAQTGSVDAPERQAARTQITQVIDQVIALGNTRLGNEYIFGGGVSATEPFAPDGTYLGDGVVRQMQIDEGVFLDTNHTGDQVLAPVLDALKAMQTALDTGTEADIQAALVQLDGAQQTVYASAAEIGARQLQLGYTTDALARRNAQMQDRVSGLRDADPTEATVNLLAAQTSLQQAYAAVSRVLSLSITDYLR